MVKVLQDICDIRFGYYTKPTTTGDVNYLQISQFNEYGQLSIIEGEKIDLDSKSEPHLLKDGDVLFVGKGNRLFAWCYQSAFGPYVASSIFFVLKPDPKKILPEYLTAILNAPSSQAQFQVLGAGTNIFSIRKSELSAFELPVPALDRQRKIAEIARLHEADFALTHFLLGKKKQLYSSILTSLLK